jgi:uncharacterized membrane protein
MQRIAIAIASTATSFVALDLLWLSGVAINMYRTELGALLLPAPKPLPALLFYLIYLAGMVTFCVLPGLESHSWSRALLNGAMLGLVAYGAYDLTNLATLAGWSMRVTVIDMIWGTALTGACSAFAVWLTLAIGD